MSTACGGSSAFRTRIEGLRQEEARIRGSEQALVAITVALFAGPPMVLMMFWESMSGPTIFILLALSWFGFFPFAVEANRVTVERIGVKQQRLLLESASDTRPPWLLLRSFENEALAMSPSHPVSRGRSGVSEEGKQPFSRALSVAVRDVGRVVVLGHASSERGNPHIHDDVLYLFEDDAAWHVSFTALAKVARAVIVVPETTGGLLAELNTLRELALIGKTLVWMQPATVCGSYGPEPARLANALAERWQQVRSELSPVGIHLPSYDPEGMLYLAAFDYSIRVSVKLAGKFDELTVHQALAELGPSVTGEFGPLSEAWPKLTSTKIAHGTDHKLDGASSASEHGLADGASSERPGSMLQAPPLSERQQWR